MDLIIGIFYGIIIGIVIGFVGALYFLEWLYGRNNSVKNEQTGTKMESTGR